MYLDESDANEAFDVAEIAVHIAADEIAEFAAELHARWAPADHDDVRESLLFFCRRT